MTDEKLIECSASATGVYIRIMCIMHKSEQYGTILLKQKHKQTDKQILNFASQLAKSLPYDLFEIEKSITELLDEKVIEIDGDLMIQKRMVKDNDISIKRSNSGSLGGKKTQNKTKNSINKFAKAKVKANTEYETVIENENNLIEIKIESKKNEFDFSKSSDAFKEYFLNEFIKAPKQKKKSKELQNKILIDLQNYDEPFAIDLMKKAVLNNWQGYKFDKTDEQYSGYLRKKENGNNPQWKNGGVDGIQRSTGKQSHVFTGAEFSSEMQERIKGQGIFD